MRLYYSPVTVFSLPLSRMARVELDYNLKKLFNVFKFSLENDSVFVSESTSHRSFRKKKKKISEIFLCSKKYTTHKEI